MSINNFTTQVNLFSNTDSVCRNGNSIVEKYGICSLKVVTVMRLLIWGFGRHGVCGGLKIRLTWFESGRPHNVFHGILFLRLTLELVVRENS